MSEYTYTAEDFAAASFAIDPSASGWVRCADGSRHPWYNPDKHEWSSDDGMAQRRCIPVYAEPYSPEALRRAWEHGEKPGPGDVAEEGVSYIWLDGKGQYALFFDDGSQSPLSSSERVVYRPSASESPAPERDPVADLAQALEDALPEEAGSPVALRRYAESLVKYGVRVTDDE